MTDAFSPDEQSAIIKEFLDESAEHIENLNRSLLIAEDHVNKDTDVPDEHINEMFRAVHTIKGSASFLGFVKVHTLAHHMETLMDKVRRGKIKLTTDVIDTLFKGFDGLERLISSLEGGSEEELDIDDYIKAFDAAAGDAPKEAKKETKKAAPKKETAKKETKKAAPKKAAPKKAAAKKTAKKETAKKEEKSARPKIKIDKSKYLNEFIEDAKQHIDQFNAKLLQLEKKNHDESVLQELFRIAHTIKGAAGTMGFAPIEKVVHKAESIFDRLRNDALNLSENIFSVLFEAVDIVDAMIKELRQSEPALEDIEISGVLERMEDILNDTSDAATKKPKTEEKDITMSPEDYIKLLSEDSNVKKPLQDALENSKNKLYCVLFCMQKDLPLKDIKFLLIKEKLASVGAVIKAEPDPEATHEDDSVFTNSRVFIATSIGQMQLEDVSDFDGIDKVEITEMEPSVISQVCEKFGIDFKGSAPAETEAADSAQAKTESTPGKAKAAATDNKKVAVGGATVRIDIQKLDKLMNLAGELVILKAQLNQMVNKINSNHQASRGLNSKIDALFKGIGYVSKEVNNLKKKQKDSAEYEKLRSQIDSILKDEDSILNTIRTDRLSTNIADLGETTSKLSKISSDIQNGVMDTRMVPIEGVFTRFRRLVRDIAKSLDKDISLIIIGEDTELDKKIIDDLGDPLTHMVRNAVDHGIESKEERVQAGKPEKGTIILKAFHEGNRICIEISDDGKGLDKDAIAQKAVDRGLVSPEAVADLTDSEKFEFIFMPGFSTAKAVTELSGRGVGLDVVRKMIENINGTVEIKSDKGQGTTFILKIPLTLAIIPALLVIIGGRPYALPLESVVEIIKVKNSEFYSIDGNDTVKLRDHALSIIKLEEVIGMSRNEKKETGSQKVVVITDGVEQIGVSVDELVGEEEIVIKSLSEHFANVIGIAGASVLGDGRIALILDPLSVMKEAKTGAL